MKKMWSNLKMVDNNQQASNLRGWYLQMGRMQGPWWKQLKCSGEGGEVRDLSHHPQGAVVELDPQLYCINWC